MTHRASPSTGSDCKPLTGCVAARATSRRTSHRQRRSPYAAQPVGGLVRTGAGTRLPLRAATACISVCARECHPYWQSEGARCGLETACCERGRYLYTEHGRGWHNAVRTCII
ncbi:hypothetical protein EXIGLDRAFT_30440 [Exidia glandulosa HHB12029]|uniref:Uncharacterized protein n=1 Tax=Exidia glandulosa HHB12029 TaxID=1314781 RepID=A0A165IVB1_EXIGL|nr:hypothetical protein EXIGLDRAFT_30440 [Exidia glandulosa HHB12029]